MGLERTDGQWIIYSLRALVQTAPQNVTGKALFAAFIDFEKAYDRVNREFLFQKLAVMKIPEKLIQVIR